MAIGRGLADDLFCGIKRTDIEIDLKHIKKSKSLTNLLDEDTIETLSYGLSKVFENDLKYVNIFFLQLISVIEKSPDFFKSDYGTYFSYRDNKGNISKPGIKKISLKDNVNYHLSKGEPINRAISISIRGLLYNLLTMLHYFADYTIKIGRYNFMVTKYKELVLKQIPSSTFDFPIFSYYFKIKYYSTNLEENYSN